MASSFPAVMLWLMVVIGVIWASTSGVNSTPATTTRGSPRIPKGVGFGLRRRDQYNGGRRNLTRLERLQHALNRDTERLARLLGSPSSSSTLELEVSSSVKSNWDGSGEFTIDVLVGTPGQRVSLVMDTGNDVTWINSLYANSSISSSFQKYSEPCQVDGKPAECTYDITYRVGSTTISGDVSTDNCKFDGVPVQNVKFVSAQIISRETVTNNYGVAGLCRVGRTSLVSQFDVSDFSYCLPALESDSTGMLTLGSRGTGGSKITATLLPIRDRLMSTCYDVDVQGIYFGGELLGDGGDGMIIDTGTTAMYLPLKAYIQLIEAVGFQPGLEQHTDLTARLGVPCYTGKINPSLPSLAIDFGMEQVLKLPHNSWIYDLSTAFDHPVTCLLIRNQTAGSPGILGNSMQQNMQVTFDLVGNTVSFETSGSCV